MSDFRRHARQVVLPEVGVAGQQLLRDSSVLIVGCGGLGSPAALYLAAAGVGRLVLADRDRVERSNLQRQLLYTEADVGRRKLDAARERLLALDASLIVETLDGDTELAQFPARVAEADVVLDCTDNFPARFAINAACLRARKPLVSGAAIRLEGQVAAFDLRQGGPCYACLYPDAGEPAEACEDAGVLGPVVGVIGAMQALLAIQLLLGHADNTGVLHCWDARCFDWRKLRLLRDPACPHCGPAAATA
ncbi:HesA/MoeB/ThiF family protein [Stagnimonas aquatica]|uniref:HesA/MoeB/ThiF family protein n=1 Tax=Stagnimonas aquatica TaxID=2689987 RepID=A0A3N0VE36_9GAMM|nr:HesA/MoeB/ThiF family protein [Stagnimonas aquatica]ROH90924.1 HesA/MoeB/ThiF family protein [Stagnimonas aquatica]